MAPRTRDAVLNLVSFMFPFSPVRASPAGAQDRRRVLRPDSLAPLVGGRFVALRDGPRDGPFLPHQALPAGRGQGPRAGSDALYADRAPPRTNRRREGQAHLSATQGAKRRRKMIGCERKQQAHAVRLLSSSFLWGEVGSKWEK